MSGPYQAEESRQFFMDCRWSTKADFRKKKKCIETKNGRTLIGDLSKELGKKLRVNLSDSELKLIR